MYAQAYADDIIVLVSGKMALTVAELLTRALGKVSWWCDQVGLRVNPQKQLSFPLLGGVSSVGLESVLVEGAQ